MTEIGKQKGDSALVAALAGGSTVRDAAVSAGVSERTARSILELGARLRESEELEKRVAALEAQAEAEEPSGRRRWGT
jgi:hypothetical protein